jgi:hypothetical protein
MHAAMAYPGSMPVRPAIDSVKCGNKSLADEHTGLFRLTQLRRTAVHSNEHSPSTSITMIARVAVARPHSTTTEVVRKARAGPLARKASPPDEAGESRRQVREISRPAALDSAGSQDRFTARIASHTPRPAALRVHVELHHCGIAAACEPTPRWCSPADPLRSAVMEAVTQFGDVAGCYLDQEAALRAESHD